jgi:hypothetical protein
MTMAVEPRLLVDVISVTASQLVTLDDRAGRLEEHLQQGELDGGQLDRLAGAADQATAEVHLDVVHAEPGQRAIVVVGRRLDLGPAQDRTNAGYQLARVEGLREVVVGAELEPDDAIDVVAPSGQHEHRDSRRTANGTQDVEAADARQHHVEDQELIPPGEGSLCGSRPINLGVEGEPLTTQVLADQVGKLHVVVEEKHSNGPAFEDRRPRDHRFHLTPNALRRPCRCVKNC